MEVVKVRKVGNSNVITLPRALQQFGFTDGAQIVVEAMPDGEVRLIPVNNLRKIIRASGRKVARQHRAALDILADAEGIPHRADRAPAAVD